MLSVSLRLDFAYQGGFAYAPLNCDQSWAKASHAIAPGSGRQLTYLGSWCVSLEANRSTCRGPKRRLIWAKTSGLDVLLEDYQSCPGTIDIDPWSGNSVLGHCSA